MVSRTPIIRQVSWIATIPQFLALAIALLAGTWLLGRDGWKIGGLAYLAYSMGSRRLIPTHHRKGIRAVCQQDYSGAIPHFEESLSFFDRYPWIDKYRSVILMSPSAAGYTEMGMANLGFCYAQLGDGQMARKWYNECLERYPESGLATTAITMMDAGQSVGDAGTQNTSA